MSWDYLFESKKETQHKVFISYYHKDDEYYRNRFEDLFGHLFINRSVKPGDIDTDVSTEYIKCLIQQNYITGTSVVVVLVGPNTGGRKYVDWEISVALSKKVGGYSGLLGISLPDREFWYDEIPPRLADNVKRGYAKIYTWDSACVSESRIKSIIEEAFQNRIDKVDRINNSREHFKYNRCGSF